ncbi:hypothetical protein PAHAL_6G098500 [Panicum hallii]|uniref:Uncharacterized protein n=1 Tax=Panicum hallii TaxID=206008 RepID=A0A2S3I2C8_9POAL|nr:hypothetical protein PAHAL_6G098500 [Panicum hallii]
MHPLTFLPLFRFAPPPLQVCKVVHGHQIEDPAGTWRRLREGRGSRLLGRRRRRRWGRRAGRGRLPFLISPTKFHPRLEGSKNGVRRSQIHQVHG